MSLISVKRILVALVFLCVCHASIAEEGGTGHYMPGSMASFMDGVSPTKTFILRYNLIYYRGSVGPTVSLPIAGESTLGAGAGSWAHGVTAFWTPGKFSDKWTFAMSATIPFVFTDVTATIERANGGSGGFSRSDNTGGIGDVVLMPVMFNYNKSPDFNVNLRVAVYAPTGSYEVGRLANTGKNFWTIEPTVGFMYFGTKNLRELSVFTGIDLNTENPDTKYKSGTQFHVEGTLAQHFALGRGLAGFGATSFYYKQITDDSGEGANFGAFRARDAGIGPVLSYSRKVGGKDVIIEGKWLHEFATKNRLQGDIFWLKVMVKL